MPSARKQAQGPDVLIVGAGIAGLHCALRIKQERPYSRIFIAEGYGYIGGRIHTYHPKLPSPLTSSDLHWENGAGRIHSSHRRILNYIKKYKLTSFPISERAEFRAASNSSKGQANPLAKGHAQPPIPDPWNGLSKFIYRILSALPKQVLASHTIQDLLEKVLGDDRAASLCSHFPYRSELTTLRADAALHALKTEMGTSSNFMVVGEGLSTVVDSMVKELKRQPTPVQFLLHHTLIQLENSTTAVFKVKSTDSYTTIRIEAPTIILALHSEALSHIPPFNSWPLLSHIQMKPLLRIYAIFPTDPSTGLAWFATIPKTITNSPIRYFIPIDAKRGVAMISYTDDDDTKIWLSIHGESKQRAALLTSLRALFPEATIPDPLFLKFHPWSEGCSYWKPLKQPRVDQPTTYQLSRRALRPFPQQFPSVFVCGESYSTRQAWIEGALEHADLLLDTYRNLILPAPK